MKRDGKWQELQQTGSVNDIALSLKNIESVTETINITEMFGAALAEGEYRLTKSYSGEYFCSAQFVVSAA